MDTEKYYLQRKHLINEDRALRVDAARLDSLKLTATEAKAEAVVRAIRIAEAASIWDGDGSILNYDPLDSTPNVFPGMAFLTGERIECHTVSHSPLYQARETVTKTELFRILKKMPKGGLLHAHLDAMVNIDVLIRLALAQPAMHVRVPTRLTASNIKATLPQFKALPPASSSALSSLTSPTYGGGEWVPLHLARETFDESLGGPGGFDSWVKRTLTINPSEAYGTHNTPTKIWAKFTSTFLISHHLVYYIPIWEQYIREFILSSVEDGISYVEARINFLAKYMTGRDGLENVPHREWLLSIDRVINEVKAELAKQGRQDEFVGLKIIYTTIRFISPEELEWYTEDALALKQEFPHLIAGFDLVGHEDTLKPLIDYIEPLTKLMRRREELGVDLPFIFHAGETLGDGNAPDMNLYDAILLGTKRIGHGYSLVKHPKLMEICREKGIAVEVCPISYVRLTSSMPAHPLPILVNHGIHVSLCSDDPAVFGNMGLTFDFYQVLMASEVTGLLTLGEFARDSIKYSTLEDDEKAHALGLWEKRWLDFLEWVGHTGGN
ncbi:Metallo-dependent hydrolase [Fomitopsis serialis]|uniref:Metallo-dependent hydrolase n=1 Tax=Fomitopsis serialis TaxID=139415 RepID=UPI002007B3A0|nr:Metallo-dependent hydrolase [Neoantrodia serialis]KAH9932261.1 Metallo-dependent hydrolase [Neoantrodia serialis]